MIYQRFGGRLEAEHGLQVEAAIPSVAEAGMKERFHGAAESRALSRQD